MDTTEKNQTGRRLAELRRSGAAGKHNSLPKGERDRRNRERRAVERSKEES